MAPPRTVGYRKVDKGYRTPCWIWTGATNKDGYGVVMRGSGSKRGTKLSYKYIWEREHGPLPKGQTLDHLCRQRNCVRPSHMQPVSMSVNSSRREAAARKGRR